MTHLDTKETITLAREQETLLIPLYSKAQPNPILKDDKARQILEAVQYDFGRLNVPQKTVLTLLIRAKQLDVYTADFVAAHPDALILHLGCGLDSRCLRVPAALGTPRPITRWVDLDLPDVIELRRIFFPETESYRLIASSVTDLGWIDTVDAQGSQVLIIAEGLFMYIPESELRALIRRLHEKFPGAGLVFDAFSKMTVSRIQAHPSLQKTGATIRWGVDDPREMEGWAAGIRFQEEWFFSQSPDIPRLNWFYRFMFRLTAGIPSVQRAQRLVYLWL
jgi:O-methyltransferase involved in polyketide biosynthesis